MREIAIKSRLGKIDGDPEAPAAAIESRGFSGAPGQRRLRRRRRQTADAPHGPVRSPAAGPGFY